jgi:periplasmic protein TonB
LSTAFYRTETGQERSPVRRRAISLALAVAIEVLLILAFLTLDFTPKRPEFEGGTLSTFDLPASADEAAATKAQKPAQDTPRPTKPVRPPLKPKIILPERPLDLLPLSRDELEAADISKLGTNVPGAALAQGNAPSGNVPGDSRLVGTAPNGEPLYAAEWYREPTDTELATYLPKTMPEGGGFGLVACRTIARYHVDDCVELGQGPPGSHLAGAVRQAAWQFLVRPPRVGGKVMVGEWVRIRVDYTPSTREQ